MSCTLKWVRRTTATLLLILAVFGATLYAVYFRRNPLPELLRRVGEDPAKLRWAILSHVHLDHAGGLMDLPPVPVLLTREELQFAADPSVQAKGYVIAAPVKKFPP